MRQSNSLTDFRAKYLASYYIIAIIPAFNEALSIKDVVANTRKYVNEVVVIDDCSIDSTDLISEKGGAKVIRHLYNTGVGGSLRTGYQYCLNSTADVIIQLDADGQHDPEYIPVLVKRLIDKDKAIVTGSRFLTENHKQYSFIRRMGIRFFSGLIQTICHQRITDITSGFRAYRINAMVALHDIDDKHWAVDQTMRALLQGLEYDEVPVEMPKRFTGGSQFTLSTFLKYPASMIKVILTAILFKRRK